MGNFNSIMSKAIANYKSQFVPTKDDKVRITMDGKIVCPSQGEYRFFSKNEAGDYVLSNVPEELCLDVPVYRISKPISQLQAGDTIKTGHDNKFTYHIVTKVGDGKISTISYGGNSKKITPINDFFLGAQTVSVVVNIFGNGFNGAGAGAAGAAPATGFGGMNPMMLLALSKDGGDSSLKSLLPLMMMQGGAAPAGFNPMMLALLGKDGDSDLDLATLMLMQSQGGFSLANMFGTPVATTSAAATEVPAAADAPAQA